jgi:hypothetical protein
VAAHCRLLARTLDRGGGCPGVCVRRVEVTGLTIYHPPVASDGGICVSQLDAESLDLVLSGQQMSGPNSEEKFFSNKNWIFEYTKALEICRRRFRKNFDMRIFLNSFRLLKDFRKL